MGQIASGSGTALVNEARAREAGWFGLRVSTAACHSAWPTSLALLGWIPYILEEHSVFTHRWRESERERVRELVGLAETGHCLLCAHFALAIGPSQHTHIHPPAVHYS